MEDRLLGLRLCRQVADEDEPDGHAAQHVEGEQPSVGLGGWFHDVDGFALARGSGVSGRGRFDHGEDRDAGAELFMFSSDYPHPEGTKDPVGKFEKTLEGVAEEIKDKFYRTNYDAMMKYQSNAALAAA